MMRRHPVELPRVPMGQSRVRGEAQLDETLSGRAAMFRRFLGNVDGNYAVITAIIAVPLLTGAIGAVDYYMAANHASAVQNSLDAAGLAIASKHVVAGTPLDQLKAYGEDYFHSGLTNWHRLQATFAYDPSVDPASLGTGSNSLSGTLIQVSSNYIYEGLTGFSIDWPGSRKAVVAIRDAGDPVCVLALDPAAESAVKLSGTTDVSLEGCILAANSIDHRSITRAGAAEISARCVSTAGAADGFDSSKAALDCEQPQEGRPPVLDPLSGVSVPSYTGCKTIPSSQSKTLSPGTYCDDKWKGNITLETGTYILRGVDIQLGGNGSLVGHGVTLFLTQGSKLTINGNQEIELTAPTEGPYAGITIFQENGDSSAVKLNGTAGTKITGFIYAPDAEVTFSGNSDTSAAAQCVRVIGKTVVMTGTSRITADCEGLLGRSSWFGSHHAKRAWMPDGSPAA